MKKCFILICISVIFMAIYAQESNRLTVGTRIDSVFVFGFDLSQSRSAKGCIWDTRTLAPVTPQNYSQARKDTIDGKPVVHLYRQVAPGNHPLNGWETWMQRDGTWSRVK